MREFDDDHAIDVLRGAPKLSVRRVRKALASRCAWLVRKLDADALNGRPVTTNYLYDELRATAQALEAFDEAHVDCHHEGEAVS